MSEPIISVLLPVKNAVPYLKECLDSILGQSEKQWELIAIDDYSTDQSYNILKSYADKDSRIKVFKNNAHGIIPALRRAYLESKGQLISRMDADDVMSSSKLEKLKSKLLEAGPGHITTGLVRYFSAETLGNGYIKYQNWLNELSLLENNFSDIYKECVIPSPCWMIFREDLDRCEAFELDVYPEDYDLVFRFYKNNLKIKTIPEILHHWRDYQARTSRNDPNYADVHFFDLKIRHFLALDYSPQKQIILWGTGRKGKEIAKILNQHNITFRWITDNPKKIGKDIYNVKIESVNSLQESTSFQLIIAIAAKEAITSINQQLKTLELLKNKDFFVFC